MPSKKKKPAKKSSKKKIIKRKPAKKTIKKAIKKKVIKKKPAKARKPAVKAKKLATKTKKPGRKEDKNIVGVVTHYFSHVRAAVIRLKAPLSVGDKIKIKGHTTDFTQNITSMQIDHVAINQAKKGAEIGIQVNSRARQHDTVYLVHSK